MTMAREDRGTSVRLGEDAVELLRSLLLCQLAEYADRAAESHAVAEPLAGQPDVASWLEREMAAAAANHFDAVVHEARAALQRIDGGAYGACERCGVAIPYERLVALPHARRCVSCPDPAARSPF
ncbi:MAG TPA: TraR/DksA C4-type zinc finger protein [Acidimicrobiales bacterium]